MREIINNFIKQNEAVLEFLENRGRDYKEADYVIPQYNDFLVRSKFNVALGLDYANILQLSNDDEISGQFDLKDIAKLFASLLKIQEYNLDAFVNAAYFEYSVMNNNSDAQKIAELGINNANEKIEELQKLLHLIRKESKSGA
ncbi:MAG: hypothetical protein ABIU11_03430 [Chitinophagaceae bacterium]